MQPQILNGNPDITWDYSDLQDTLYIKLRQDFDASFYDELDEAPGVLLRYTLDDEQRFVGITVEQGYHLYPSRPDDDRIVGMFMILVAHYFGTDMPTDGNCAPWPANSSRSTRRTPDFTRAGDVHSTPPAQSLPRQTVMLVSAAATSVSKLTKARRTVAVSW